MLTINKLTYFIFFIFVVSFSSYGGKSVILGDDSEISFVRDTTSTLKVIGKTTKANEFEATSENAGNVIAFVKEWFDKNPKEDLEADFTNLATKVSEHLFFYGLYDDEGNFEAHAIRPNAHVIKWKETSIPPSNEDLTVSD